MTRGKGTMVLALHESELSAKGHVDAKSYRSGGCDRLSLLCLQSEPYWGDYGQTYCGNGQQECGEDNRGESAHQVFLSDPDYLY